IFGDRGGDTQRHALLLIVVVAFRRRLTTEDVKARCETIAEEVRLGERKIVAAGVIETATDGNTDELSATKEVLLLDGGFEDQAVAAGGVAGTDTERAGRLVFDIDNHHDAIGSGALRGRDVDGGEVAKGLEPSLGARDHLLIERVAFTEVELTANDIVARAGVAAHFDPLDIGTLALIDEIGHAHGLVGEVTVATGGHAGERITSRCDTLRDGFH